MLKIYLVCLVLVMMSAEAVGQSFQNDLDNQKKYWFYRQRLLGRGEQIGFVDIGAARGQSLPANGRNLDSDCSKDWVMKNLCDAGIGKGRMDWGDATAFQGFYIATLVMEWKNLQREGLISNAAETAQELYWAIKAIDRLDFYAEEVLGKAAKLNGFFLRDDVPADFIYSADGSKRFKKDSVEINCISSNFSCHNNQAHSSDSGRFISQDQVIGLFLGYSFVNKFMPEVVSTADTVNFRALIIPQMDRMMSYLIKNNWKLKGPDGVKISNRWGGDFRPMSKLLLQAYKRIVGAKHFHKQKMKGNWLGNLGQISFDAAWFVQAERNHWLILAAALNAQSWNRKRMTKKAGNSDRIVFALAYAAIYDTPIYKNISSSDIQEILNTAPIEGPCFNTKNCNNTPGWMSVNRWVKAKDQNGNKHRIYMEWNGLDYMLLYNLYHYLYGQDMPMYGPKQYWNSSWK